MAKHLRWARRQFLVRARRERLDFSVYAAMVDSLFGTLVGFAALGLASILLAATTFLEDPGLVTAAALVVMIVIAAWRAVLMIAYRRWRQSPSNMISDVVAWELRYAALGISMMLGIGVICAYNVARGQDELALIVSIIVTMGIAGCIAGRNGSRPFIVRQQLAAVFTPLLAALAYKADREALSVLVLIVVFVCATMSSVQAQYSTLRSALSAERRIRQLSIRVRRSKDLLDTALDNMTSGLLLFDSRRKLVVANERVRILFGRDLIDRMIGRPTYEICHDLYAAFGVSRREGENFTESFRKIMDEGGEGVMAIADHRRQRTFEMRLGVMENGGVVFNVDDVTEQRAKDSEIYRLAHNDALTGLPNRVSLAQHLAKRQCEAERDELIVVMYLDLDRFKEVNDDLGHAAGDYVLSETARRLTEGVREGDFVARIAGDEFVFVFSSIREPAKVEKMAARLIEAVSAPHWLGPRQVTVGASAGLCIARHGEGVVEETLRTADVALYEAKAHGRGLAVWYETAMDNRSRARRELINELRGALTTGIGLNLHYQPIFDARSNRIVACEALMRWTHEVLGPIDPAIFIAAAEENGLIGILGRWTLERACRDALLWPDNTLRVAVNVSALQFQGGSVACLVHDVLEATGLPAQRLEVEITESVFAGDLKNMTRQMYALAERGVSIALDDFGTGFSSLSLLHKLPFNKLKLDRSFVADLDANPTTVNLIASIVQMAHIMRKEVVVEGVETATQLALIIGAQARLVQGYYFSRPLARETLVDILLRTTNEEELRLSEVG